jgi:GntR family transcriptional regulator, transcriptional repressor for pyruvate dehydrogenase complex
VDSTSRQPTRRSEKVAESVAREIIRDVSGMAPGMVLPSENSMLERYHVSRGSLREALRILEVQGLIMIKPGPGGGPILLGPNSQALGRTETLFFHLLGAQYKDLLGVMVLLEPMLARMSANRPQQERRSALRQFLDAPTEVADDEVAYSRHNQLFHESIMGLCGNPVLALLSQSLNHIIRARIGLSVFTNRDERIGVVRTHAEIARAITDGKPELAELLMRDHMEIFSNRVLGRRGGLINEIIDWHRPETELSRRG